MELLAVPPALERGGPPLAGPTGLFDRKRAVGGEWGRISILEVMICPPEVFVRSLSHQRATRLKRLSTRAEHQSTRIRAAILLASNVKTPVPQIARMWLTDGSHVRKGIHEFNEEGFDTLRPEYRGGDPAGSPTASASAWWRWPVPVPTPKGCR